MLKGESKEDLIKMFDVNRETKIAYIISSLLNIVNRWNCIRIYVYNIKGDKNEKDNTN